LKSAITYCLLVPLSATLLFAQGKPSTPLPARPTVGTNPSSNPSNNTIPTNNNTNPNANTISRPIYLSGKVVLQDGTPPPEIVKIERVCGGSPHAQGYTDAKGRFQFQVDSGFEADQDASDGRSNATAVGGLGSMSGGNRLSAAARGQLAGCELRAVLPGFFSGSVTLGNHNEFDNPDVGVIVLRRAQNVEGTTISMSSLTAPKDALKAYEKGRELLKKEKTEEASRSFEKAVEVYPKYATAWFQLGLLQARDQPDQSEASFRKSIEADPKFVSPYLGLTLLLEKNKHWDKALEVSDAVIKLNPADFPQAHFYKAAAQYNLKDDVSAEKSARKAVELDIRHEMPQAEKLLGIILTQHGDLAGGSEHLRKYLEMSPNANDITQVRAQIAHNDQQPVATKQP
jgi:tetratricopeptide (TPR) repeat protein